MERPVGAAAGRAGGASAWPASRARPPPRSRAAPQPSCSVPPPVPHAMCLRAPGGVGKPRDGRGVRVGVVRETNPGAHWPHRRFRSPPHGERPPHAGSVRWVVVRPAALGASATLRASVRYWPLRERGPRAARGTGRGAPLETASPPRPGAGPQCGASPPTGAGGPPAVVGPIEVRRAGEARYDGQGSHPLPVPYPWPPGARRGEGDRDWPTPPDPWEAPLSGTGQLSRPVTTPTAVNPPPRAIPPPPTSPARLRSETPVSSAPFVLRPLAPASRPPCHSPAPGSG